MELVLVMKGSYLLIAPLKKVSNILKLIRDVTSLKRFFRSFSTSTSGLFSCFLKMMIVPTKESPSKRCGLFLQWFVIPKRIFAMEE